MAGMDGMPGPAGETGEPGDRGVKGHQAEDGVDGDKGDDGEDAFKGYKGVAGENAEADDGEIGMAGAPGAIGMTGTKGIAGMKGEAGTCIETAEFSAWRQDLSDWMDMWDEYIANGGCEPCQSWESAVGEVDTFLDTLLDWYFELLDTKLTYYNRVKTNMQNAFDEEYQQCLNEAAVTRSVIMGQLDDIQAQLDALWATGSP
jgi:hypothetical protein